MENVREMNDKLYGAVYDHCSPYKNKLESLWKDIKEDKELLEEAIEVERDRFDERNILKGTAIARCMLIDYDNVDKEIYQKLVNTIYSDKDIARCVLDGYSNGGDSFLLMTLWNDDLKLTSEQKKFAVSEAMNKMGTVKHKQMMDEYSKKLDEKGINDNQTVYVGNNPVGAKTGNMYMASMFNSIDSSQAHGSGAFDIRYWILRNPNWTIEEKEKLVYDFYADDYDYAESLEDWKIDIINDDANYQSCDMSEWSIDICYLYDYTLEDLIKIYENTEVARRIKKDINFCKTMEVFRPKEIDLEDLSKVNVR